MKRLINIVFILSLPLFLFACLYGQCIDGPCALEREAILKSIKGYGEYWTKADMTKESWRQDWVACGGMRDGGYSVGERLPGETDDFPNSRRKSKRLGECMQAKGYTFSYTNP